MARGRKKKEVLVGDELEDAIFDKLYEPYIGKRGDLRFRRSESETLNLEETSHALWCIEGRNPNKKPLTKMGVLKVQMRALEKIRAGLARYGITSLDDVLDVSRGRSGAKQNKFEAPENF